RSAVNVEVDTVDGPVAVSSAAKDPLFELDVDAVARTLGVSLDVGATGLLAPWNLIDDASLASGAFALALGGISGEISVSDGDQSITIETLGLGDSTTTVKLDDHTLIAADLNADDGRRFDLTIEPA